MNINYEKYLLVVNKVVIGFYDEGVYHPEIGRANMIKVYCDLLSRNAEVKNLNIDTLGAFEYIDKAMILLGDEFKNALNDEDYFSFGHAVDDAKEIISMINKRIDSMKHMDSESAVDTENQPDVDVTELIKTVSEIFDCKSNINIPVDKLIAYMIVVSKITQKPLTTIKKSFEKIFERMEENEEVKQVCDDTRISERDFGSVLDGIAVEWESYDPFEKVEISMAFAGERHSEDLRVLMENYGDVNQYLKSDRNEVI